jgi:hypothetical protein
MFIYFDNVEGINAGSFTIASHAGYTIHAVNSIHPKKGINALVYACQRNYLCPEVD